MDLTLHDFELAKKRGKERGLAGADLAADADDVTDIDRKRDIKENRAVDRLDVLDDRATGFAYSE